jgi:phosphotransferase system HPr (HPr) family protein
MRQKALRIAHSQGLHIRVATALVGLARRFRSSITLEKNGVTADARSMLALLMLAAQKGSRILVTAVGEDEVEALAAVEHLMLSDSSETWSTTSLTGGGGEGAVKHTSPS